MSGNGDASDKSHLPTEKRLAAARRDGDVPKSNELMLAGTYAAFLAFAVLAGPVFIDGIATRLSHLIDNAGYVRGPVGSAETRVNLALWSRSVFAPVLLLLLAPLAGIVAMASLQRAMVFAPSRLAFKLRNISPISSFRKKFGPPGLVEFAKSTSKLVLISSLAWLMVSRESTRIFSLTGAPVDLLAAVTGSLLLKFLIGLSLVTLGLGGLDYFWQRHSHRQRLRMSLAELRRESKDFEGDPHIKAQRHRRAADIAKSRMLLDVPKASVIIVNPSHYAVALKWDRSRKAAPVCLAKGADEIAARIRELAAGAGIPIHRDAPTARSLYALVDIGQEILPAHYRPVAAAIRFAETVRKSARTKRGRL